MNILNIKENNLSKETQIIIMENKGYRSEIPYGSGVRNLKELIAFEISELGNSDIVLFFNEVYKLNLDSEYDENSNKELDLMIQENYSYYTEKIINFITKKFNCKSSNLNAVWLATKEAVSEFYCKGYSDKNIDEYILPSKYLIISDLGFDGTLIAYTEQPTIHEDI